MLFNRFGSRWVAIAAGASLAVVAALVVVFWGGHFMFPDGLEGGSHEIASVSPSPTPAMGAMPTPTPSSAKDQRNAAVRHAVVSAEASVLGITPRQLTSDLRSGQTVSSLAGAKGLDEQTFDSAFIAKVTPALQTAVSKQELTSAQASKLLARWQGTPPDWNGVKHPAASPSPAAGH